MDKIQKTRVLEGFLVMLLLLTALVTWNIYSWLILIAIVFLLVAWYYGK